MSDTVKCPACGETQRDLWDHDWGSREELTASCGSCGADYMLIRTVSVSYEAKVLASSVVIDARQRCFQCCFICSQTVCCC